MQIYEVGGAVRDALLGLPAGDRDWVVVGATPQQMLDAGFQPVGKDFPVFLHPRTHEEYALARTERKSGRGYHGFVFHTAPDVTLEEDLARRDLTINAIARGHDGTLVDPHGGRRDLAARVLRHVSPAFAEDPVRLLRLARFAARFADFSVAPETMDLLRQLVDQGEVDALVPERVWQELARGLMADKPSRMLAVLRECGALKRLLPEVDRLWGVPQRPEFHPEVDTGVHLGMVLDEAARTQQPLAVRWALLCHDLGKGTTPADLLPRHHGHEQRSAKLAQVLAERLRVPGDCRDLADVVAREHGHLHASGTLGAAALLRLFERCDAIRRPERFALVLQAGACDARGRLGHEDDVYGPADRLPPLLAAARAVDTATVAAAAQARGAKGPDIGRAVHAARADAIAAALAA
ncbi:multifunctional CCA addition/repair protein [Rubrivivax albus]|uniref:Multifunctional CCA protein n=1 Tax=Rubrivivax albus TaxID=2499835 RepID=A0A3S3SCL0_9BURK|nr:multifunctional CCA addition/repair protein [Rubrivivax albus]RVT51586.1 multifunctional CCA addition/repair protein [Rubrivivax albus]